jgi:hypothetical protein
VVQRISFRKKMKEKNIIWLTISSFFSPRPGILKLINEKLYHFGLGLVGWSKRRMWVKTPPRQLAGGWGSWPVPAYSNFFVKVSQIMFFSFIFFLKEILCTTPVGQFDFLTFQ